MRAPLRKLFAAFFFTLLGAAYANAAPPADPASFCAADWPARHAACQPVPLTNVHVAGYLGQRIDHNLSSLLLGLQSPIPQGFEAAATGAEPPTYRLAADSDLYKWLEGACYIYARTHDTGVKTAIDRIAEWIIAVQHHDGYINTQVPPKKRWDPSVKHDLYIAGHFFEAAAAHHRATGERHLLEAASRWADYLIAEYENGNPYYTTAALREHSEYELGLLRLYRATGEHKYLDFAFTLTNELCHVGPTLAEVKAGGGLHAVRVGYLLAAMADLHLETGDADMLRHLPDLWREIAHTRTYVTGAIGSHGEHFSPIPYDLPHTSDNRHRTMGETCATVAMIMFSWRMHAITGDSAYFDVIEHALYNHYLGAIALNGQGTFYYNPMRVVGDQSERTDHWHTPATARCMLPQINKTSCCMPNCWRFLGALPEYLFSHDPQGVYINLYSESTLDHALADGRRVKLAINTRYPHDGAIAIRFTGDAPTPFTLRLRIPEWCDSASAHWPDRAHAPVATGEYLVIDRTWNPGDTIHLDLDMPVRMIPPDPNVEANAGQVVFARGPVLFCLEQFDHPFPIENVRVTVRENEIADRVQIDWRSDLLNGVHLLQLPGLHDNAPVNLTLVPWSVRANRSDDSRWIIFLPHADLLQP